MAAKGIAKLIEECGELQQVLGKKLAWWDTDEPHWDGTVLNLRMEEEMADVIAAITFVSRTLGLNMAYIDTIAEEKLATFTEWNNEPGNNEHGIDSRP